MTPSPAADPGSSHLPTLIVDNIVSGIIDIVGGGLILTAILSKRFRSAVAHRQVPLHGSDDDVGASAGS